MYVEDALMQEAVCVQCHINRSDTPSSFASPVTGATISSLHQRSNTSFLEILSSILLTDLNANVFSAKGKSMSQYGLLLEQITQCINYRKKYSQLYTHTE